MRKLLCVGVGLSTIAASMVVTGGGASALQITQNEVVSDNPVNWTPHATSGRVEAVAQVGNTVVIGGTFKQVAQSTGATPVNRSYIVGFDATTGQLSTTFQPVLNGSVSTLAASPDGKSVFVGGSFGQVNGVKSLKLARLNITDGSAVPGFKPPAINAVVSDLKVNNNRLFIAGIFSKVGQTSRSMLAQLDPNSGALSSNLDFTFTGYPNPDAKPRGGKGPEANRVRKIDVTPDGTKMVVVGNFASVSGADREQIAIINLTTSPATLGTWQTDRLKPNCYNVFTDYIRDVEFSPDGSYFAIGTTGGYGSGPPSLCDSVSRWETAATGAGQNPTWINYTGGDSTYTVALTGSVIYTGGHMRWQNNPFAADASGPGAVTRTGIAALDPSNGLPLSWNPGRTRGQGVFDMLATPDGLWVGSDTERLGGRYHGRIGFFPLAGGHAVPQPVVPPLPVDVYGLGNKAPSGSRYLYRINAGGPAVASTDSGPDWTDDSGSTSDLRNSGSSSATFPTLTAVDNTVPAGTPISLFDDERWDAIDPPEMHWTLPVPSGKRVQVRLYLANQCTCTSTSGQRAFDVLLDNNKVLSNYDIVADVGHRVGTMKAYNITSDGQIDIDFTHVTENPLVDAIEVVDNDFVAPPSNPQDALTKAHLDNSGAASENAPGSAGIAWSNARGAFWADGELYTAWSDGKLYSRTFDGTSFGAADSVNLYGLTTFASEMQNMTSLYYDSGKIYFTLGGQTNLYSRYFSVESQVVGAQRFTEAGNLVDLNWSNVGSAFRAGDFLYWVNKGTGDLHRSAASGGLPQSGTAVRVSGPGVDGIDWRARALFVRPGSPANQAPVAVANVTCAGLTCNADGSASSDPDGSVASFSWDFGDGTQPASGTTPTHRYATAGDYTVTLTVKDNLGTSSVPVSRAVTVANAAPVAKIASINCGGLVCSGDSAGSSDPDGVISAYSWDFGDGTAPQTGPNPHHTYALPGTYSVILEVTDNDGRSTSSAPTKVTVTSVVPISYVGGASDDKLSTPSSFGLTVPASVEAGDVMLMNFTINSGVATLPAPAGWDLVKSADTGVIKSVLWSRVAMTSDAGSAVTVVPSTKSKGALSLVAYRGVDASSPIAESSLVAESSASTTHTTPTVQAAVAGGTVVSFWADKSSVTSGGWTTSSGQTMREGFIGKGGGHISNLVSDSDSPVAAPGTVGGETATSESAQVQAFMGTVLLSSAN